MKYTGIFYNEADSNQRLSINEQYSNKKYCSVLMLNISIYVYYII